MIQISQSQMQNKDKPHRYVPEDERDLPMDQQSAFLFKTLPRQKLLEEKDKLVKLDRRGGVARYSLNESKYRITLLRLVGWENIPIVDEQGQRVGALEFDPKRKQELYELLPDDLKQELEDRFGVDEVERARIEEEMEKVDGDGNDGVEPLD